MKHQWLAYVIVGLLSIGAGVAIAGLPDNVPVDATIVPPTSTVAPERTLPDTTVATTTVPPTTDPETTEPESTAATTTVPDTTEPDTTTDSTTDLPDRSELFTIVANGSNIAGAASRNVERLRAIGYTDIAPRNGTGVVEFTTIYFADEFEAAALRLADDLDLLPFYVAPIAGMPTVLELPDGAQLVAYIGLDRA
jgi:hypothetical protein